ncbi:flagellar hook-length control protein FliK [Succinispira mobilis]|uniref:flagellar hook-length control protein FliK n=1 Tax=Succinispira mobilis TaxID=78120 RepID=UPI00036629F1|nr:flagellar hook-length control protein FliK [Succinispira mobilis]
MSEALNLLAKNTPKTAPDNFKLESRKTNRESNFSLKKNENTFSKVLSSKSQKISESEALPEVDNSKALEQLNFLANLNMHKQVSEDTSTSEQNFDEEKAELLATFADIVLVKPEKIEIAPTESMLAIPGAQMPSVNNLMADEVVDNTKALPENLPISVISSVISEDLLQEIAPKAVPAKQAVESTENMITVEQRLNLEKTITTETSKPETTVNDLKLDTGVDSVEKTKNGSGITKLDASIEDPDTAKLDTTIVKPNLTKVPNLAETTKADLDSTQKLEQVILNKLDTTTKLAIKPPVDASLLQQKIILEQQPAEFKVAESETELPQTTAAPVVETLAIGAQTANNNTGSNLDFAQSSVGGTMEKNTEISSATSDFKTSLETALPNSSVELTEDKLRTARQLVENVRLLQKAGNTEMMIRLKPEHLGEMVLKISIVNGSVNANFHTNNAEARGILEAAMPQLRQELSHSGFKVHDVGVYAGLGEFMSKKDGQDSLAYNQKQKPTNLQKINNSKLTETELQQLQEQGLTVNEGIDYKI